MTGVFIKVHGLPAEFADRLPVLDHRFLTVCAFVVFVVLRKSIDDVLELYLSHADVFVVYKGVTIIVVHEEDAGQRVCWTTRVGHVGVHVGDEFVCDSTLKVIAKVSYRGLWFGGCAFRIKSKGVRDRSGGFAVVVGNGLQR